jgi:hypothetical protein
MNNINAVRLRRYTHLDKLSDVILQACHDEIVEELDTQGVYKEIRGQAEARSGLASILLEMNRRGMN